MLGGVGPIGLVDLHVSVTSRLSCFLPELKIGPFSRSFEFTVSIWLHILSLNFFSSADEGAVHHSRAMFAFVIHGQALALSYVEII